jgi:predicted transcriptional regulator
VITGLSEAQKRESAYRMNLMRRHLSKAQTREIAGKLRMEGWTQDAIAKELDCSQPTASRWIHQFMQTHKPHQPDRIQGKDGKDYPHEKTPKSAKQQADGTGMAEMASMLPTVSEGASTDAAARLAEEIQQGAKTASEIRTERPVSRNAGVEAEAADLPNASFPDNSATSAAAGETSAAPSRSLPAAWVDDAEEQAWVCGLEALSAKVETLQEQGSVPCLSAHWHPETRIRCLNAIRRMKKALKKLEEMIRHEIGEPASTNGNNHERQ